MCAGVAHTHAKKLTNEEEERGMWGRRRRKRRRRRNRRRKGRRRRRWGTRRRRKRKEEHKCDFFHKILKSIASIGTASVRAKVDAHDSCDLGGYFACNRKNWLILKKTLLVQLKAKRCKTRAWWQLFLRAHPVVAELTWILPLQLSLMRSSHW